MRNFELVKKELMYIEKRIKDYQMGKIMYISFEKTKRKRKKQDRNVEASSRRL